MQTTPKTRHTTVDERTAILRRLREIPNREVVAEEFGRSAGTVFRIATSLRGKENLGVVRRNTIAENPITMLIVKISGGMSSRALSEHLGLNPHAISGIMSLPEHFSIPWIKRNLIPTLLDKFHDKKPEIRHLEVLTCELRPMSATQAKSPAKTTPRELQEIAGLLLHDLRSACDLTVADVGERVKSRPIVKDNLEKIEKGMGVGATVSRAGIEVLSQVYEQLIPDQVARYTPTLQALSQRLGRR